jgi:hypothetical protein
VQRNPPGIAKDRENVAAAIACAKYEHMEGNNSMDRRVFIGGPFKRLIDTNAGVMDAASRRRIQVLVDFFVRNGYQVHNAHVREKWGEHQMTPEECTEIDFAEIAKCSLFVAFPGCPCSPGTHIEIGWASALKKKMILLLEEHKDYAFLIRGLHMITNVGLVYYKTENDYLQALAEACRDVGS